MTKKVKLEIKGKEDGDDYFYRLVDIETNVATEWIYTNKSNANVSATTIKRMMEAIGCEVFVHIKS